MRTLESDMPIRPMILVLAALLAAGSAQAAVKFYDSTTNNGTPHDSFAFAVTTCPPVRTTPDQPTGAAELEDDSLGTVTLNLLELRNTNVTDLGEDVLGPALGPGAFIFVARNEIRSVGITQTSNTSGVGAHGPSSTAPGGSTEWGIVSGWEATGGTFCISSPVEICNQNGFAHGATAPTALRSATYDLGTWSFDAEGDYLAAELFIEGTAAGGTSNTQIRLRGSFVGASLPALPLVGFTALGVSLAVLGVRALVARR
jgi:hypothetical protein